MLEFREVTSENELNILCEMKVELMDYLVQYANKFNIQDDELMKYSMEQALSTIHQRVNYLIFLNEEPVGMSQIQEQISDVDNRPILFVHSLYIKPLIQKRGIGGKYLRYLCRKYNKRIEIECWYDIPAKSLYERAGFLPMMTRYVLPTDNRFMAQTKTEYPNKENHVL